MYFTSEPEHISMLRDTIGRFAEKELTDEKLRAWDKACEVPLDVFHRLAETGICGITIDEEYGGSGRDLVAAVAIIDELARHGGAALAGPFIHCAFYGGMNISENGSERQKKELLPKLAAGEILMAYGLSEPNVGGDLAAVETIATLSDDKSTVIINGTKRWCTGARFADYMICLVRSGAADAKYKNLSMAIVPLDTPGIEIFDLDHIGLRYAKTTDVVLTNVEIPVENILGGFSSWNRGWDMLASEALDVEKLEITGVALGIAAAAVDNAWEYAQQRKQFGHLISAHQSIRHDLVEAKTKLQACRHMLYHAAHLAQNRVSCSVETSMAKLFVGDTALEIVLKCQQVMGAYGCSSEYAMERHVRDIMVMPIVGGSSKMQKNNIAARLRLPG